MNRAPIEAAARSVGCSLSVEQWSKLESFDGWLRREATKGGGIGPDEVSHLEERHLADSVLFAAPWEGRSPPRSLIDVGSGVGLPGIVLGILWQATDITLLDRSGRRTDLSKRAIRVLGLSNVQATQADVRSHRTQYEAGVMRAVVAPAKAIPILAPILLPGGTGVVALSRSNAPTPGAFFEEMAAEAGCQARIEERKVLDLTAWLLIMVRS